MKEIIIINGTGESGKDTFVKLTSKYAKTMNYSSVDKIKEMARIIGYEGQKQDKDRKFLSDLKKLVMDYNDFPFTDLMSTSLKFKESDNEILFVHIREPEEIKRAVNALNAKTLLIKREGKENIMSNNSDAHVDEYPYDYTYINTTLENLEEQAKSFVENLK